MNMLESARLIYGDSIIVASGFRCPTRNAEIGGALNSPHMRGTAIDPVEPGGGYNRYRMIRAFFNAGALGFGMGDRKLHFDVDSLGERAWFYPARMEA